MPTFNTFGKRVRVLRISLDLSQIDLRDRLAQHGVTIGETYISELERTNKMPSLEVAVGMAKALGTSTDYLGGITDDSAPATESEDAPVYFSPEADEIAKLVDTMSQSRRTLLLELARTLA